MTVVGGCYICGLTGNKLETTFFFLMTTAVPPVHVQNHLCWWGQIITEQRSYSLFTKFTNSTRLKPGLALADLNSSTACTKQTMWCKKWLIIPSMNQNLAMSIDVFHYSEPIVEKERSRTPVGVMLFMLNDGCRQRGHHVVRCFSYASIKSIEI